MEVTRVLIFIKNLKISYGPNQNIIPLFIQFNIKPNTTTKKPKSTIKSIIKIKVTEGYTGYKKDFSIMRISRSFVYKHVYFF